jgi:hypothetical protein
MIAAQIQFDDGLACSTDLPSLSSGRSCGGGSPVTQPPVYFSFLQVVHVSCLHLEQIDVPVLSEDPKKVPHPLAQNTLSLLETGREPGLLTNSTSEMLVQVWARIYVFIRGSIRTSLMLEEDVVELLRLPARYIDQQVVL